MRVCTRALFFNVLFSATLTFVLERLIKSNLKKWTDFEYLKKYCIDSDETVPFNLLKFRKESSQYDLVISTIYTYYSLKKISTEISSNASIGHHPQI